MIIAASIIFETVIHFTHKYFRAVEDFKSLYLYTIFSSIFSFIVISFSVFKWHYTGLLISYTLCNLILMLFPFVVFRNIDVSLLRLDFKLLKAKFSLAIKYLLLDILGNTFKNLDKIMIVRFFSFFSLGIYSFFYRIILPINLFFDAIIDVMFPKIVRIENVSPEEAVVYLRTRLRLISHFFLLLSPFYIGAVLLLVNVFMKEYAAGNELVVYLPALFYLYVFNNAMMIYLISSNDEMFVNLLFIVSICVFFLTSLVAIRLTDSYIPVILCNIFAGLMHLLCYSLRIFKSKWPKPVGLCLLSIVLIFIISRVVLGFFNRFGVGLIGIF